jgi:hypothetical protein
MQLIKRARRFAQNQVIRQNVNRNIRKMAKKVAQVAPKSPEGPIVVSFNASTRIAGLSLNAAFAMLTGWSLRLQGVRVVNFVCQRGMSRCVLGTIQDNVHKPPPCQKCLSESSVVYHRSEVFGMTGYSLPGLAQRIEEANLEMLQVFQYEEIPLGQLCLPSMRWILRRHNLLDDEPTRTLYRHYILSAFHIARQFEHMLSVLKPSSVMVFNGMQYPEAVARWVARKHKLVVYSHEVGLAPFSVFFTEGDATAYPVEIPDAFELSESQNKQLDEYLSKRFKGDFSMAGVAFWPEMQGLDAELLKRIGEFKQVVPVFTNVIFDTSQPHANTLFTNMFAWLDEVLDVIKAHPETLFVIRAHPDESRPGKASRESVTDWVHQRGVSSLQNVIFVGPDSYFSSYEMIQRAKFVMIYNSTIGMEASILGAPVLCAGKARFTQLETVFYPKSKEEYLKHLDEFLSTETVQAPSVHRMNARRFLYYQLFKTSLPFDLFLEPDGIWPGFVRLKSFSVQDLLPENSTTLKIITEGLLHGKPFLMPDET